MQQLIGASQMYQLTCFNMSLADLYSIYSIMVIMQNHYVYIPQILFTY